MSRPVRASRSSSRSVRQDAQQIAGQIRALDRAVNREIHRDIAESGLTGPQVRVLEVLFDSGPLSLKELSGQLHLTHSTVSGIIDRLERRRFVQRAPDPDDHRVSRIQVTEEVNRYAKVAARRLFSPLAEALRGVPPAERERYIGTLNSLAALVGAD